MSAYTDRGVREIAFGLREAKAALARRRAELYAKMGEMEAEIADLGKIEAAYDGALEVLRAEQVKREKSSQ